MPGAPNGPSQRVRAGPSEAARKKESKERPKKEEDIVDADYEVVDEDKDK